MNLWQASLLAMIAIAVSFIIRTVATLYSELFRSLAVNLTTHIILMLTSIALLLVFYTFYRSFRNNERVKWGAIAALIGSGLLALMYFRGAFVQWNRAGVALFDFSGPLFHFVYNLGIWRILPISSNLLLLLFLIIFYIESANVGLKAIRIPALLAAIGVGIVSVISIIPLIRFFLPGTKTFLMSLAKGLSPVTNLALAFAFAAIFYFFFSINRHLIKAQTEVE